MEFLGDNQAFPTSQWLADRATLLGAINQPEAPVAATIRQAADQLRAASVGPEVHLRGLIEISNFCRNDCHYCGLRHSNRKITRYRMTAAEIIESATSGANLGYRTVVLQSGEDPGLTAPALAEIIRSLKSLGLVVTLSLGERLPSEYELWRKAGAERYLMRHETANPQLYQRLHPGQQLQRRIKLLQTLKALDYQVGSGFMVGLPGQTASDLLADLELIRSLDCEMVGIGPFIPHPDTPLGNDPGGSLQLTLLMVALARLTLPYALIPATTALGTIDPMGREAALQAGANVVMPNLTPTSYRSSYQIYPNKICITDAADTCRSCIGRRIAAIGRTVSSGPGHHQNWLQRRA